MPLSLSSPHSTSPWILSLSFVFCYTLFTYFLSLLSHISISIFLSLSSLLPSFISLSSLLFSLYLFPFYLLSSPISISPSFLISPFLSLSSLLFSLYLFPFIFSPLPSLYLRLSSFPLFSLSSLLFSLYLFLFYLLSSPISISPSFLISPSLSLSLSACFITLALGDRIWQLIHPNFVNNCRKNLWKLIFSIIFPIDR